MSIVDDMNRKDHFRTAVWQTPFHPRTSALNTLNEWHRWKDRDPRAEWMTRMRLFRTCTMDPRSIIVADLL